MSDESKIDVLAVLDYFTPPACDCENGGCSLNEDRHEMLKALAAVAELIEADKEYDAAYSAYGKAATGTVRNEAWERVLASRTRRAAALASIEPQA